MIENFENSALNYKKIFIAFCQIYGIIQGHISMLKLMELSFSEHLTQKRGDIEIVGKRKSTTISIGKGSGPLGAISAIN